MDWKWKQKGKKKRNIWWGKKLYHRYIEPPTHPQNSSFQYQYNIKQASDEIKEKYQ